MSESVPLAPSALKRLGDALAAFEAAPAGQLNASRAEFDRTCKELGWPGWTHDPAIPHGRRGALPWARRMLGRDE